MTLLTIKEAAAALNVSRHHIQKLIDEADAMPKQSRWKFGKELIDLTPMTSRKRVIRIHPGAICAKALATDESFC